MRRTACAVLAAAMACGIGTSGAAAGPLAIEPMTTIGPDGSGYFSDPDLMRLAPALRRREVAVSGTTRGILRCALPIAAGCFTGTPVAIDAGTLRAAITRAGREVTNFQNLDVFQDDGGGWHAVLAIGVRDPAQPGHWTVLVHAHPGADASPDRIPSSWSADTVLSGSFSERGGGNYDGKYLEEDGRLYLLYVRTFAPRPDLRNGIVIQPMLSPTRPAPAAPTTLLTPGDRFGPLASERYADTRARLVEAPAIARIGGRYALIYSTGAYQHLDYKVGVAWSDTLLPEPGGRYRKVLETGPQAPGDVRYLLQSQRPDRANYTPDQVFGPGVATAVPAPDGTWTLCFAGYDAADRPVGPLGVADARRRRPYLVRLRVAVPAGTSVATASDADLSTWLEPERR